MVAFGERAIDVVDVVAVRRAPSIISSGNPPQ